MNDETPFEGEIPGGDDAPYEWLDEWLCEYVDGTMDPSLEAVFEQYVEANPELKAHVERLQKTRDLLCECGPPEAPSPDVESKICTEVECDMLRSSAPVSDVLWHRPLAAVGLASSVAVALVIGFLVGTTVVGPPSAPLSSTSSSPLQTDVESEEIASPPSEPAGTPWLDPVSTHSPLVPVTDSSRPPSTLTNTGRP